MNQWITAILYYEDDYNDNNNNNGDWMVIGQKGNLVEKIPAKSKK